MSTVHPSAPQGSASGLRLGLLPRVWRVVAAGFGIGLLLFLMLWLDMRDNGNFYRPEGKADSAEGQVFEPLPTPMANGDRSASGLSEAAEDAMHDPRPIPSPPMAVPRAVEMPAQQQQAADGPPPIDRPASGLAPGNVPTAITKPAPSYPAEALRNGETGTVVVRIEVGADGKPTEVSVSNRSGSRALDRAAVQAAKRWRFRPAQENGRAVPASVEVPIAFTLDGR